MMRQRILGSGCQVRGKKEEGKRKWKRLVALGVKEKGKAHRSGHKLEESMQGIAVLWESRRGTQYEEESRWGRPFDLVLSHLDCSFDREHGEEWRKEG